MFRGESQKMDAAFRAGSAFTRTGQTMRDLIQSDRHSFQVAIVDDDDSVLHALSRLLSAWGYQVTPYAGGSAFLQSLEVQPPDILFVDLRMPGLDGLTLQEAMRARGVRAVTVFLSAHADVASSVRALRGGAIDFLEKPCDEPTFRATLERATDAARRQREAAAISAELTRRWQELTRREGEVCRLVVTGRPNKQIAAALGTTEKTVKVHRARVMRKMQADSVASLVRMFDSLEDDQPAPARVGPRRRRAPAMSA
jgi:FixJ family two-component response regulator